jgi:hypothetical protein
VATIDIGKPSAVSRLDAVSLLEHAEIFPDARCAIIARMGGYEPLREQGPRPQLCYLVELQRCLKDVA